MKEDHIITLEEEVELEDGKVLTIIGRLSSADKIGIAISGLTVHMTATDILKLRNGFSSVCNRLVERSDTYSW